ncbi:MAG: MCE family protein, partial [Actinobacteria bacterium]|nr:MCE family protein [Actinomycetota bacterium]
MTTGRLRAAVAGVLGVGLLAGCSSLTLESLPAPGRVSGPTYHVTVTFDDVQTLVIGAEVKLGGAVVGEVSKISTRDYHAYVDMNILKRFPLGTASTFEVRFTTPLGEDYVSVASPGTGHGVLADGARVPVSQTQPVPGIEDTFAALSTLLNGGGLGNLQTIVTELDTALNGHTTAVRDTLVNLDQVVKNLNEHRSDIDQLLVNLKRMAVALNQGSGLVEQALAQLPATMQVLAQDTGQITTLLTKVGALGERVKAVLGASQQDILAEFATLRPTLDALRSRESELAPTFQSLINFGRLINQVTPGDYLNVNGTIYLLLDAQAHKPTPGGVTRS